MQLCGEKKTQTKNPNPAAFRQSLFLCQNEENRNQLQHNQQLSKRVVNSLITIQTKNPTNELQFTYSVIRVDGPI